MEKGADANCPNCSSKALVKAGLKKLKNETIQRYRCSHCQKYFSDKQLKHKSYPPKILLNSISIYNLGHTLEETKSLVAKKFKMQVPLTTFNSWLKEYKGICTFSRLRKQSTILYKPEDLIRKQSLNHIQPYTFK